VLKIPVTGLFIHKVVVFRVYPAVFITELIIFHVFNFIRALLNGCTSLGSGSRG
jgi:hypothetical protein